MSAILVALALAAGLYEGPAYEIFAIHGQTHVYIGSTWDRGVAIDFVRAGRGTVAAREVREIR